MSETSPQLVARCPNCNKGYAVKPEALGRTATCTQCKTTFTIQAAPPQSAPPAAPQTSSDLLCPVCQCPVAANEPLHECTACHTRHHKDCWEYNRGCGLYGCKLAPETEKFQDVEIPASFWGQTEKKCPKCWNIIQAAAVRCRHCGITFESARPQESSEFQSKQQLQQSLPLHRKIGVILLIAAILPCTAPIAAIVGLIWYFTCKAQINALPTLQASIGKIAVGVAVLVTVLLGLVAAVYSMLH